MQGAEFSQDSEVDVSEPAGASGAVGDGSGANAIDVKALSVIFGGVKALTNVSTSVNAHEIVAIIGPNGAGKTTLLNAICGIVRKSHGEVRHFGKDISNTRPAKVVQGGVGRSFQDPRLIESATVLENILCGAHTTIGYSLVDQIVRRGKVTKRERQACADANELLAMVGLDDLAHAEAKQLAYGRRKMVDIIRATMSKPSVLLLDEPSSGLDGGEQARVEHMLLMIHEELKIPMLIVEHHMDLVRVVADRVLGLVSGSVAMQGATNDVLNSDEFRATMTGDTDMLPEGVTTLDV